MVVYRTIHANPKHFLGGSRSYFSSLNPSTVENQQFYINYTTYHGLGAFSVPPTAHEKSQSRPSGLWRSLVMRMTKRPCSISWRKDQRINNSTIDPFQTIPLKNHTGATLIPSLHYLVPQSGSCCIDCRAEPDQTTQLWLNPSIKYESKTHSTRVLFLRIWKKDSQIVISLGQTLKLSLFSSSKSTPPEISGRWGIEKVEKTKSET